MIYGRIEHEPAAVPRAVHSELEVRRGVGGDADFVRRAARDLDTHWRRRGADCHRIRASVAIALAQRDIAHHVLREVIGRIDLAEKTVVAGTRVVRVGDVGKREQDRRRVVEVVAEGAATDVDLQPVREPITHFAEERLLVQRLVRGLPVLEISCRE